MNGDRNIDIRRGYRGWRGEAKPTKCNLCILLLSVAGIVTPFLGAMGRHFNSSNLDLHEFRMLSYSRQIITATSNSTSILQTPTDLAKLHVLNYRNETRQT
jgi:hypothetical protein